MFISLIPWSILQGYKLAKIEVRPESIESFGSDIRPIKDANEPSTTEHRLQVGSDSLVSKAEDSFCNKVVSWRLDSSTTLGEQLN